MTVDVKKKLSDMLEETSRKGWTHSALLLAYRTISSIPETPCGAHTSGQTSFHGKKVSYLSIYPLFH